MAKKITVKQIPGRIKPWMVDLSARISESGSRERHFFATKREAQGFVDRQEIRLRNVGTDSALLSPAQREAAMLAFDMLGDDNPARLVDVVEDWLARQREAEASVTMGDLWDTFLNEKDKKSTHYVRQIRSSHNRFTGLDEKLVTDLCRADIEAALAGCSPSAFNGYLRVIRALLNFAIKRDWAKMNVAERIDFMRMKRGEVEILANRQVARLLVVCRKYFPEDLPYNCIGLFAGVRPEELLRMDWGMIQLEESHILLPAEVTKTERRRVIEIEPALKHWLEWHRNRGGKSSGPVVERKNLRNRLRSLRVKAKILKWPQDGMRHTYASNHLAYHGNLDRLLLNMGHSDAKMLWIHYHKAVTKAYAKKFWQLYPKPVVTPPSTNRRPKARPARKLVKVVPPGNR